MSYEPRKPVGIKIIGGKGNKILDNTFTGDMDGIVAEGTEDLEVSGNRHTIPPIIKPLVASIKKPLTNNNKCLKIIVGILSLFLASYFLPALSGVTVELWKESREPTSQSQPQKETKELKQSEESAH
jgi:hypothetical protein